MARRPVDEAHRAIITLRGSDRVERTIYQSVPGYPLASASFGLDEQQRILAKTGLPLKIEPALHPRFWKLVESFCRTFASMMQADLVPWPTARQVRNARDAATRLKATLPPILGQHPADLHAHLFACLFRFVETLDRHYPARAAKPARKAGSLFVPRMGEVFADAFGRTPSEGPNGPFARFVLACLQETQGMPEQVGGDWVRKHVRRYKRGFSGRSGNLWEPLFPLAWDGPDKNSALPSNGSKGA